MLTTVDNAIKNYTAGEGCSDWLTKNINRSVGFSFKEDAEQQQVNEAPSSAFAQFGSLGTQAALR